MSKLITTEDGYEIRLGQKNPTCYPCCFEGSVCACRSDLCIKHRDNYIREHGKLPQGEGMSKPFFDNFCDSPAFYANASPDVVRNYYMKVVKNQWWS